MFKIGQCALGYTLLNSSSATFVSASPPDSYKDMIRELMAYDALCFSCSPLPRDEQGKFSIYALSSPLHWSRQTEYPWAVLESGISKSHTVLEISGGHSVLKFALAKRCRHVIDTEYDKWYMPTVQETIDKQCNIWGFDNITQVWSDVRSLPYPDNWFDRIFCISVLEHIPSDHLAGIKEMVRVLKPTGFLMLSMDVVVSGKPGAGNNFYCDMSAVKDFTNYLGIENIAIGSPDNRLYAVKMDAEDVAISTVLIKYYKSESGIKG